MFYVFITLAVVLSFSAAIVATRRKAVALMYFAPAFSSLAAACMLPGHRNMPGSAALLTCCAGLLVAAGVVHLREKRTVKHG